MVRALLTFCLLVLLAPTQLLAEPAGRITGLGGLFVSSKDPKALAAWYRDVLGITLERWGGAALHYDAPVIRQSSYGTPMPPALRTPRHPSVSS